MKTYGLLGKNISYSLSPFMHNAAFKALNIEAEYKIFDTAEDKLGEFFSKIKNSEISGCNITIPYKEKAIEFVDDSSEATKYIGALNTVVNRNNTLWGHNTDYQGFMKSLKGKKEGDLHYEPNGGSSFIFGAGGAAKAVIYVLQRILEFKKIIIADIDSKKAEALANSLIEKGTQGSVIAVAEDRDQYNEFISKSNLVINATPCGMKEEDEELFDYRYIHEKLYVFDLIYAKDTPLVRKARERGAKAVNGLNMLLYQAAASFAIWTGKDAPIGVMREALLERIK